MGQIRVIAGEAKGRKLETPKWEGLRPTSDRLRETLFNILAPRLAGARVLDGYAGMKSAGNACTIVRAGFVEMAADHWEAPFDLVLLDPPYDDPSLADAIVAARRILSDDGLIVLEHATRVAPPAGAARTVKAGDSSLSFYGKRNG